MMMMVTMVMMVLMMMMKKTLISFQDLELRQMDWIRTGQAQGQLCLLDAPVPAAPLEH